MKEKLHFIINSRSEKAKLILKKQIDTTSFWHNNFDVFIPTEDIYATLDTSTPPGAYHLLNFASSIGFKSGNGGNYKINLRIENLLNNLYKNYLNRLRYFTHEMGRNIMLSVSYSY